METAHLVTRYNEYTNDLTLIGISTSIKLAHKLVDEDFASYGLHEFKKIAGNVPYGLNFYNHCVLATAKDKGTVLSYEITQVRPDTLVQVQKF